MPFELLSTTVEVTPQHVTIRYSQILGTSQTETIPMPDIHAVEVDADLLFGELIIVHGAPEKEVKISKFHKADAKELEAEIKGILDKNVD